MLTLIHEMLMRPAREEPQPPSFFCLEEIHNKIIKYEKGKKSMFVLDQSMETLFQEPTSTHLTMPRYHYNFVRVVTIKTLIGYPELNLCEVTLHVMTLLSQL